MSKRWGLLACSFYFSNVLWNPHLFASPEATESRKIQLGLMQGRLCLQMKLMTCSPCKTWDGWCLSPCPHPAGAAIFFTKVRHILYLLLSKSDHLFLLPMEFFIIRSSYCLCWGRPSTFMSTVCVHLPSWTLSVCWFFCIHWPHQGSLIVSPIPVYLISPYWINYHVQARSRWTTWNLFRSLVGCSLIIIH